MSFNKVDFSKLSDKELLNYQNREITIKDAFFNFNTYNSIVGLLTEINYRKNKKKIDPKSLISTGKYKIGYTITPKEAFKADNGLPLDPKIVANSINLKVIKT